MVVEVLLKLSVIFLVYFEQSASFVSKSMMKSLPAEAIWLDQATFASMYNNNLIWSLIDPNENLYVIFTSRD